MHRPIALALGLGLGLTATAALAQQEAAPAPQQPATMDAATTYEAARNQLGILKFCEGQGHTGAEATANQQRLVAMLPQGDDDAGASAEEKGAGGMVSIAGTELSLADAASSRGSSVEAQCKQIEAAVNDVAKRLPAG
ncbi:pore-forming ESAT-6 family protein [Paracoccus spongiarum]|uniref:Pore-forming ESAT-6 family protein n=1 Tax=Paracoccus spongiarum TaxID=3064387 RepID=A0ABT9JAR2_9RHOB|nr:pore-forming ESAT-6 family protein [Paracoccus sp. 2205BS29-5]MDP5306895.1 pore-forming ESAT-6 family protein [Paracoccus sp. 2205BS29-5]